MAQAKLEINIKDALLTALEEVKVVCDKIIRFESL